MALLDLGNQSLGGAPPHLVSRVQVLVSRIPVLVSRVPALVSRIPGLAPESPDSLRDPSVEPYMFHPRYLLHNDTWLKIPYMSVSVVVRLFALLMD